MKDLASQHRELYAKRREVHKVRSRLIISIILLLVVTTAIIILLLS